MILSEFNPKGGHMKTLGTLVVTAGLLIGFGECEPGEQALGEDLEAADVRETRATVEAIAAAVSAYRDCRGELPAAIADLTKETTVSGVPCGPTLDSIPRPRPGWTDYTYTDFGDGTFSVRASTRTQTVSAPAQELETAESPTVFYK